MRAQSCPPWTCQSRQGTPTRNDSASRAACRRLMTKRGYRRIFACADCIDCPIGWAQIHLLWRAPGRRGDRQVQLRLPAPAGKPPPGGGCVAGSWAGSAGRDRLVGFAEWSSSRWPPDSAWPVLRSTVPRHRRAGGGGQGRCPGRWGTWPWPQLYTCRPVRPAGRAALSP